MDNHVEALVGGEKNEMTVNDIEGLVIDHVRMVAEPVPLAQTRLADLVGHVEGVKFVRNLRFGNATSPCASSARLMRILRAVVYPATLHLPVANTEVK